MSSLNDILEEEDVWESDSCDNPIMITIPKADYYLMRKYGDKNVKLEQKVKNQEFLIEYLTSELRAKIKTVEWLTDDDSF